MTGLIRNLKSRVRRLVGERSYQGMAIVKHRAVLQAGNMRALLQKPGPPLPELHALLSQRFLSTSLLPDLPEASPLRRFTQVTSFNSKIDALHASIAPRSNTEPAEASATTPSRQTSATPSSRARDELSIVAELGNRLGKKIATIFDVGAYYGSVTERLLQSFPNATFHLFEPQDEAVAALKRRYAGKQSINVYDLALNDSNGVVTFHMGAFPPTSSMYDRSREHRYFDAKHVMSGTRSVNAARLDDFCAQHGIASIDILKLDAQGAELSILRGAGKLLSEQRIDIIYTEFFAVAHYEGAPLMDEIWSFLRANGYGLYQIFLGPNGSDGQLRYGDAIFLSRRYRENYLHAAEGSGERQS